MLKADGFDEAVIGIGERCGQKAIIVYDALKCVKILVERDGMIFEEAREFFEFNTLGAWVGDETPMFVWNYTMEEIDASNE
mgnify:FL=1|tara:strand:+ start:366 stop:608 length:243 start_codon:yes stop_codon:yes gene_type:complete